VAGLNHPDLHWFVPILRPKGGSEDQQVEEAEELLAEEMADRRANPLYGEPDPMASHPLAAIRLLLRRVALRPFQGQRRVILLANAERLVVQEANQEAANALLKVLEEPPQGTYLILTARTAQVLLPTIRSRLVPFRVGPVGDEVVRRFLQAEMDPPPGGKELERLVVLAEGAIGRAVVARLKEQKEGEDRAADRLARAIREGARSWAAFALEQPPWSARGAFTALLDALAMRLRTQADKAARERPEQLPRWLAALKAVERTREEALGNANPQLALAVLAQELEALV
jgi:DNA polymerase-3 subunit delta'